MLDSARGLVHLVEDRADLRIQITDILQRSGFLTVVYERPVPFLDVLPTLSPGCVVANARLPDLDGLLLLRTVRGSGRPLRVILVADGGEVSVAVEAMKLGAADILQVPVDSQRVTDAVGTALKEAELLGAMQDFRINLARLTIRERQVFDLMVRGESSKSIARRLDISPRTVEIYRANVMRKMSAENISELIRTAVKSGVI